MAGFYKLAGARNGALDGLESSTPIRPAGPDCKGGAGARSIRNRMLFPASVSHEPNRPAARPLFGRDVPHGLHVSFACRSWVKVIRRLAGSDRDSSLSEFTDVISGWPILLQLRAWQFLQERGTPHGLLPQPPSDARQFAQALPWCAGHEPSRRKRRQAR